MQAVARDLEIGAIKIGMLATRRVIKAVAEGLNDLPASGGARSRYGRGEADILLDKDAIATLKSLLLPRAVVITPNLPEPHLLGTREASKRRRDRADKALMALGASAVLIKGGHAKGDGDRSAPRLRG